MVDTDSIGYCSGAGGSGVTVKTGRACYEAAQEVKRQMIDRAAFIWDVKPDDVEYDNGTLRHRSDSETRSPVRASVNSPSGAFMPGRSASRNSAKIGPSISRGKDS